jgi:hypothetical protein
MASLCAYERGTSEKPCARGAPTGVGEDPARVSRRGCGGGGQGASAGPATARAGHARTPCPSSHRSRVPGGDAGEVLGHGVGPRAVVALVTQARPAGTHAQPRAQERVLRQRASTSRRPRAPSRRSARRLRHLRTAPGAQGAEAPVEPGHAGAVEVLEQRDRRASRGAPAVLAWAAVNGPTSASSRWSTSIAWATASAENARSPARTMAPAWTSRFTSRWSRPSSRAVWSGREGRTVWPRAHREAARRAHRLVAAELVGVGASSARRRACEPAGRDEVVGDPRGEVRGEPPPRRRPRPGRLGRGGTPGTGGGGRRLGRPRRPRRPRVAQPSRTVA